MKTPKTLILLLILLATTAPRANAQIEREIRSFVDSTEILLNNGRKLLVEEARSYNYTKVAEIYHFLRKETAHRDCEPFSYSEHLFISLLSSDWGTFFGKAENIALEKKPLCYRRVNINVGNGDILNNPFPFENQ